MAKRKKPERPAKLTAADVWVEAGEVGYGCRQATAWKRGWPVPIGVVWYQAFGRDGGTLVQVAHSYVLPEWRRRGVRTIMHGAIAGLFVNPLFVTGDDPTKAGAAWMRSMGYARLNGQMMLDPGKKAAQVPLD